EYLSRDSVRLALPILVLVVLVLFLNFRSLRGVLLPLFIMVASILWTLGLMGLLGRQITIIGVMLPTLILIISSSYSIHFLNQYYRDMAGPGTRDQRVVRAFSGIGRTIVLAALTTIAGFAALTVNRIRPMMELGIFVVIGVFIGMVLSLSFLPSTLSMLRVPGKRLHAASETSRFSRTFRSLESGVVRSRWIILAAAVALAVWSVSGMHRIVVDTSWERFFREDARVVQSQSFIKDHFGGVSAINVSFRPESGSGLDFRSLDALRYLDTVQQWINRQDLFGKTTSLADYVRRANQVLHGGDPGAYRLPDSDAELLRILLTFKMANLTEKLEHVITDDYRCANITVRSAKPGKRVTIAETREFVDRFHRFIEENPLPGISASIAGIDLIYVSLVDYLVRSQLISVALSVVIVFIIMAITFKSLTCGLFGLIPIVFGLLLNFAAMSYFNIALDFITSMIASIAVGLGVDNAIHYLIRFTKTDPDLPLEERIGRALTSSGIPIFFTSFTLIAGFSVLLFSSFKPILYFGLLISVTMLGCLIGVVFVLPALIYLLKPSGLVGK
ncbi:MAG: efflux RND transporter permease subunit, partial [Spirochaetota bacterium]